VLHGEVGKFNTERAEVLVVEAAVGGLVQPHDRLADRGGHSAGRGATTVAVRHGGWSGPHQGAWTNHRIA
jgi:hypothetical protein